MVSLASAFHPTVDLPDVSEAGLFGGGPESLDVAADALKGAKRPRIHTGLGVSDNHLEFKLRLTREQAMERGVTAGLHDQGRLVHVDAPLGTSRLDAEGIDA